VSRRVRRRSLLRAPTLRHPAPLGYQPKPSWFGRSLLHRRSPTFIAAHPPAWEDAPEPIPDWARIGQPEPDFEFDQRVAW